MHLSPGDSVFLAIVGLLAGVMNAVAGGGTFLTFPSLVFTGIPSVPANQTSTIAVFPGHVASFWAYRKILAAQTRTVVILGLTRLLGGAVGAMIVLNTSSLAVVLALRDIAVPFWESLPSTSRFARGRRLGRDRMECIPLSSAATAALG
jgi:uncharacterized membrane protein YfcA